MLYRVLLFVHVTAVILWVGGGVLLQLFTEGLAKSRDITQTRSLMHGGARLGKSYFGPLSLLVLASGLSLVLVGEWGFRRVFVVGGLAGVVASAGVGMRLIGPIVERLHQELASPAPDEAALGRDILRLRDVGRVDTAILIAVVFLMTVKPGP